MSPRSERERVEDILNNIDRIKLAESGLRDAEATGQWALAKTFLDAILYNLVVIGEATKSLTVELRERHQEVDWKAVAGMRDIVTHTYHRVLTTLVMETLDEPMKVLKMACRNELEITE